MTLAARAPRSAASARKARRLGLVLLALLALGLAAALALSALRDTVVFFRSPAEVERLGIAPGTRFRLGGMVEAGSLRREAGALRFVVTDGAASRPVTYAGLVPDLFREGQGVVAEGALEADGTFRAATVLAKHDETYMPREVADALKREGRWGPNGYVAPGAKPEPLATPAPASPWTPPAAGARP